MNVRKFTATTTREALRIVKEALGPDAVILSNRSVNGRIEIMAMADTVVESLPESAHAPAKMADELSDTEAMPTAPRFTPHNFSHDDTARTTSIKRGQARPLSAELTQMPATTSLSETESAQTSFAMPTDMPSTQEMNRVMSEIRSMRSMLEAQLAELSWNQTQQKFPNKMGLLKELLGSGLSATLARFLTEKMPVQLNAEAGLLWARGVLEKNLNTIGNDSEILEKGGVYALVGPTGVGKTTTTAKLAARCVMRHGSSKLALITTDGYRIGGYEQLRIYGKILGVMVHTVKDESDLRIALKELQNKHTVLIDTVGVSQRDKMVAEQLAMLSGADIPVKRLLCLNATSTGETLSEVVRAYQGEGLAGCIFTKLDEAATIGNVLDIAIRQKLMVYYMANGQRVPEDLHVANKQYLIDRAFKLKRETGAYRLQDQELPALMASAPQTLMSNLRSNEKEVFLG